ncbi:MAG TPA: argininosuccinate synthase [Candidatus Polarisedimenticolia bacterium]|jgi:argininosuccinate synthase|nr:argininosuccinate synthase [Candidatus Polarisedimenticolia bacterium]
MRPGVKRAVLAYSGGLDTSIIIPWLKETYGCEVIAMVADVGQGDELSGLERRALNSGADHFVRRDLRAAFVHEQIWPALRAGAVYENGYLLGTALARPVIAREQVRVALMHGADALAHGCTGKGNDQVRFELVYQSLAPGLRILAPWREWSIRSREEAIDYAAARGVPVPVTRQSPYSRDRNLWHVSHEGGPLEDPAVEPSADVFVLTRDPDGAPAAGIEVTVGFEAGVPVALDGERLDGVPLIERLNRLAGEQGVGRADLVENRLVGIKSRGVYETPAGTVLVRAHRELESLCLDRATQHVKQRLAERYAELVYDGLWYTPLRLALDAFVARTQENLAGEVTLRLRRGTITVVGRRSPHSLYDAALGSFVMGEEYDPKHAEGFIRLFGLSTRGAQPEAIDGDAASDAASSHAPALPIRPRTAARSGGALKGVRP